MFLSEIPNIVDRLHIIKYKITRKHGSVNFKGVSLLTNRSHLVIEMQIVSSIVHVQVYIDRIGSKRVLLKDRLQEDVYSNTVNYSLTLKVKLLEDLKGHGITIVEKEVDPLHSVLYTLTFLEDKKTVSFEDRGYVYRFVRKSKTYTILIQNGFYSYHRGVRLVFSTRDASYIFVKNILTTILYKQPKLFK